MYPAPGAEWPKWPRMSSMRHAPSRKSQRHKIAAALLLWSSWAFGQTPTVISPTPTPAADSGTGQRVLPLEVTINGAKSGTWPLIERVGVLYAPREAFEEWRVQIDPSAQAIDFRGTQYLPLSAVPGYGAKVNFGNQSVDLSFSPQAFAATRLTTERAKQPVLSPVLSSVFVNYDLNYSTLSPKGLPSAKDFGALTEVGWSNPWGVLTTSSVGRNLTSDAEVGTPRSWLRLETTFTKDLPARNQTLRLGDTGTRAGMWGRTIYFGGVQWGSNFALTPGFISQPSPALTGVSSAPSTVELYVNDVLRQVSAVPTGPFAIDNIATLSGGGEARLVIRDMLGRETVISQPFFTSSQLLAKGLNDWSVEAGRVRLDLGTASNRYGESFAGGIWRHGFSDVLTLEGRGELMRSGQSLGLGLVTGLPWQVLAKSALAASRESSVGAGHMWLLGLEHQDRRFGSYVQAQGFSRKFRQLDEDPASAPTKLQVAGNFSYYTDALGIFGFGFAAARRFDQPDVFTVSTNYSVRIGEKSSLLVTASRAVAGGKGTSIGMSLVVPLDNNKALTASVTNHDGKQDFYLTASQNPGLDSGLGWRTLAGRQQGEAHTEGGVYYTGRVGRVVGDLRVSPQLTATRFGAMGGLVAADGHFFATQRVDDSFAIAEVPGYGDVPMGLESNMLTRTDSAGVALIPRMIAYNNNSVRIDSKELPISAEIDSIEQIVVPAWRSGVKVVFPVRSGRGALIKIVLDDGEPAPAGAIAKIEGDKAEFYVARRGEAFVTGLQPVNRVRLTWKDKHCLFDVRLPPESPDEIVRLGPLLCKGVSR